jgi:hypothetical protein
MSEQEFSDSYTLISNEEQSKRWFELYGCARTAYVALMQVAGSDQGLSHVLSQPLFDEELIGIISQARDLLDRTLREKLPLAEQLTIMDELHSVFGSKASIIPLNDQISDIPALFRQQPRTERLTFGLPSIHQEINEMNVLTFVGLLPLLIESRLNIRLEDNIIVVSAVIGNVDTVLHGNRSTNDEIKSRVNTTELDFAYNVHTGELKINVRTKGQEHGISDSYYANIKQVANDVVALEAVNPTNSNFIR